MSALRCSCQMGRDRLQEIYVLYLDGGNMWLVKNREIIKTCTMYKPGMPHETIKYGLRPHVFTCPAIERRF